MCFVRLRGILSCIFLCGILTAQAAGADTLSVPFPQGFVGTRGSNSGQSDGIVNFSTLGVSKAYFIQTSDSGAFGGTQGNDLSGTLRLVLTSGQTINIAGAINWRITQGATLHYFGFLPAPGGASHTITYGSNQQYTLNATSNYGLRKIGSTQSYADGTNVSGNASLSGLLTQLNSYLSTVTASGPRITGPSGAAGATSSVQTVVEGQTAVTTFTADRAVTWDVFGDTDAGRFAINPVTGALTFLTAPDFELPTDADANNTYVMTIQSTDSGGFTALQTVTVTVTDLDDTPPMITGPLAVSVPGGQTAVTGFTANEGVTWALGGTDAATFVVGSDGVVQFVTPPDHAAPQDGDTDNVYHLTLTATDAAGNASAQVLTVTVTENPPADQAAPQITGPSDGLISVEEGQTAVTVFTADEPVVWTVSGPDAALFGIDPATGTLTFATAPDHAAPADSGADNSYLVTVSATDPSGNLTQLTLTITVTASPPTDTTPPVISGPSGNTVAVAEGQTTVATLTADEPVVWAISGADAALFGIDPATGTLRFLQAPDPDTPQDADGDGSHFVTVSATDAAGNVSQLALSITATPPADTSQPIITGPSANAGAAGSTASVPEGQAHVATMTADEAVVWSIAGGADAHLFLIDPETGALRFALSPDHSAPQDAGADNSYVVSLAATDAAQNRSLQTVTVTVTAVTPTDTTPPAITGPAGSGGVYSLTIADGQTVVADFAADETVVWSLAGADAARFALDPATGVLRYLGPPGSVEGQTVLTITATDAAGNATTVLLHLTLPTEADPTDLHAAYGATVAGIVRRIETEHLRATLASTQRMVAAARDRFAANRHQQQRCRADLQGLTPLPADGSASDCSLTGLRDDIAFAVQGHFQFGPGSLAAAGSFYGQRGIATGARRLTFGEFSVLNDGAGVDTITLTARVAWERPVSDRLLLGFHIGGSYARATVAAGLSGRAEKAALSLGPYFVAAISDDLYLDGFLSVEASQNMLGLHSDTLGIRGPYTARSVLAGLALSGSIRGARMELRPELAVAFGATRIGTASFAATAPDQAGQLSALIGEVRYATLRITPELRIPVFDEAEAAQFILAPSLACDWTDGQRHCGGGLRLGLQGQSPDRMADFDIMLSAERIGGKTGFSARVNVAWRF